VYVGNLDSKVYSFDASSGKLAWSHSTGGYVYAAPAVAAVPGVTPTVFVGSYDHHFYALNARTGAARWTFSASGPISGAGSVIGRIVYFSTLDSLHTYGLDVQSGKVRFSVARGAYNPAISDGRWLFITGHSGETAYEPLHQPKATAALGAAARAVHRKRVKAKAKRHAKKHHAKKKHSKKKH
jgi:outer membrane protein assembly factor BamB